MRVCSLLVATILFAGAWSTAHAQSVSATETHNSPAAGAFGLSMNQLKNPFANLANDPSRPGIDFGFGQSDPRRGDGKLLLPEIHRRSGEGSAAVCYTMRGYRVERDDPEADATRVVGSSTCQLSSKFAVKNAVGSAEEPAKPDTR